MEISFLEGVIASFYLNERKVFLAMPSDRKDTGSSWQGPADVHSEQGASRFSLVDQEELPPPAGQQQSAVYVDNNLPGPPSLAEDEEANFQAVAESGAAGRFKGFWQYVPLILLPLLFGGITAAIVLPALATGHAYLPPPTFWVIAFLLLLATVGQAIAVYFSSTQPNMWVLGTIGGAVLFLLIGCFALFGPIPSILLLLALLGFTVYMARRSIHPVAEGYVDIVFSSGKYTRTLYSGFNLLMPWEEVVQQVNVEETHWNSPQQKVQLSRDEDVLLRGVISYQVPAEDAYLTVTQVNNWEENLRATFVTLLQTIANIFSPEDFLAWQQSLHGYTGSPATRAQTTPSLPGQGEDDFAGGLERRDRINTYLLQRMSEKVALWGVQINWVSIRDIELVPHGIAVLQHEPDPVAASQPHQEEALPQVPQPAMAEYHNTSPEPATAPQTVPGPTVPVGTTTPKPSERQSVFAPEEPAEPKPLPKEEVLVKAYKEVQDGKITDPHAIRDIAATFQAVAHNPEASQAMSFDAERAAHNLYEQARKYEQHYQSGRVYNDATKPDMMIRP